VSWETPPAGDRSIAALLRDYQPAGDAEATDVGRVSRLVRTCANPWSRETALHLTGSALIVHVPTARVLLRWHPRQRAWLQVGGHADPGECDPLAIAVREGIEETGLDDLRPWPATALVHLVIVPVVAGRGEPAHEHADLRFVLATDEPEATTAERADAPVQWLAINDAVRETAEQNLRETLTRLRDLLG
jgi:8-oxo-dGTP pyrophosphatase MutT (NUDIX family)